MTRVSTVLLVALAAVCTTASAAGYSVDASATSYLQVTAREFSLNLSRVKVKPGSLNIELVNYGEDDHDLAIQRKGGRSGSTAIGIVRPGERGTLRTRVTSGSYVLWCTISDHKARGMRAVLKVKR